ncbi:MAG: hypothetical protein AB1746_03865 [Candidatus Zixiibacteriota bacterium]
MRIKVIKCLMMSLSFILIIIISGCFAPRYKWEYWLPDKSNPEINIAGYEIVPYITAFKDFQKYMGKSEDIVYSIFFEIHRHEPIKDSLSKRNIAEIRIDSAFLVLLPDFDTMYLNENIQDKKPFEKDWVGPGYGEDVEIPADQSELCLNFMIIIVSKDSELIIESQKYSIKLTQFYDRYWILAQ